MNIDIKTLQGFSNNAIILLTFYAINIPTFMLDQSEFVILKQVYMHILLVSQAMMLFINIYSNIFYNDNTATVVPKDVDAAINAAASDAAVVKAVTAVETAAAIKAASDAATIKAAIKPAVKAIIKAANSTPTTTTTAAVDTYVPFYIFFFNYISLFCFYLAYTFWRIIITNTYYVLICDSLMLIFIIFKKYNDKCR